MISCNQQNSIQTVEQWGVFQIDLTSTPTGNPFTDTELYAIFSKGENIIKVPGFYDGDGIFRIRFSPNVQGEWSYKTESNLSIISGKKGKFNCVPPSGINHGPLKIVNTYYLQYADETPFYGIGTTTYQWTSVKQSIQEKTIETLANAPFNKIRMCVFPKNYKGRTTFLAKRSKRIRPMPLIVGGRPARTYSRPWQRNMRAETHLNTIRWR